MPKRTFGDFIKHGIFGNKKFSRSGRVLRPSPKYLDNYVFYNDQNTTSNGNSNRIAGIRFGSDQPGQNFVFYPVNKNEIGSPLASKITNTPGYFSPKNTKIIDGLEDSPKTLQSNTPRQRVFERVAKVKIIVNGKETQGVMFQSTGAKERPFYQARPTKSYQNVKFPISDQVIKTNPIIIDKDMLDEGKKRRRINPSGAWGNSAQGIMNEHFPNNNEKAEFYHIWTFSQGGYIGENPQTEKEKTLRDNFFKHHIDPDESLPNKVYVQLMLFPAKAAMNTNRLAFEQAIAKIIAHNERLGFSTQVLLHTDLNGKPIPVIKQEEMTFQDENGNSITVKLDDHSPPADNNTARLAENLCRNIFTSPVQQNKADWMEEEIEEKDFPKKPVKKQLIF